MKNKQHNIFVEYAIKIFMIILSALISAYVLEVFMQPSNLISGGFTGVAILIVEIFKKFNIDVSLSLLIPLLNLPVAILCMRAISKKFVFLSVLQIIMTSVFLNFCHFEPIFHNIFLSISIGAFIYGIMVVLALRAGGSTGGTDFIALYVSNKINKTIWEYVFVFNMILLIIFGFITNWDNAGYSIIFQFITTRTINTFYNRYQRMTIQIMTDKGDEIIDEYINNYTRGITKTIGYGGYTKKEKTVCYTIVSVYDVADISKFVLRIDPDAIINVYRTEQFYGKFYIPEL